MNALLDSMLYGGVNAVEAPYVIVIAGLPDIARDERANIVNELEAFAKSGAELVHNDDGTTRLTVNLAV